MNTDTDDPCKAFNEIAAVANAMTDSLAKAFDVAADDLLAYVRNVRINLEEEAEKERVKATGIEAHDSVSIGAL